MRKLLPVILLLLFAACKKENVDLKVKNISGKWKLIHYSGGVAYRSEAPTDNVVLELNADFTYKRYVNDVVKAEGTYTLSKGKSIYTTEQADIIYFKDSISQAVQEVKSDKLILADEAYDGFTYTYVKLN